MVVPNVLLAFWRYRQRGSASICASPRRSGCRRWSRPIRWRASPPGSTRTICGSPSPAFLVAAVGDHRLAHSGQPATAAPRRPPLAWGWSAVLGWPAASSRGCSGSAARFIAPPVLTAFFGVRQVEAQGLALALVCPGTIVAIADLCRGRAGRMAASACRWRSAASPRSRPASPSRTACRSGACASPFARFLAVTAGLLALHG